MTQLPASVRSGVELALCAATGKEAPIRAADPVGGGCINPSARLSTADGESYFIKWNASAPASMFEAEADGLSALAAVSSECGLRVPAVVGVGANGDEGPGWLLLEYVERSTQGAPGYGERLGEGLARLHRAGSREPGGYGWTRDNFIGSLPQANPRTDSWGAFWRDARIAPQLDRARASGHFRSGESTRVMDRVLEQIPEALRGAEADGESLLHGDLWSGNVYAGPGAEPVLIDPAVYRGHREVDLAMSELFGGFPRGFMHAYDGAWPLAPEYARVRRPLYQLYYLLVHVNLFGGSYVDSALGAARAVLSEL